MLSIPIKIDLLSLTPFMSYHGHGLLCMSDSLLLLTAKMIFPLYRFVSKVEEVLNDWKLIGNSTGKLAIEKVYLFPYTITIQLSYAREQYVVKKVFHYHPVTLCTAFQHRENTQVEPGRRSRRILILLTLNST